LQITYGIMKNIFLFLLLFGFSVGLISCGENKEEESKTPQGDQVEYSPDKDANIQRYNLDMKKENTANRTPCDTISVMEYVLNNYPEGTYLLDFDKTVTYNVPKSAVIYYNQDGSTYVFGIIARSKPGERLIEKKNIVGYDQSFIDFDSTKLGTAFFYLCLFQCVNDQFTTIWEAPIPSHGGFNKISLERWNNTLFIRVDFHYASGIGHIDYNYFMVNGLTAFPHLLMTYKGLNFQRTFLDYNKDKYPDYYEYLYVDTGNKVYAADSIAFYWESKDSSYVNSRNNKQTRPY